MKHQDNDNKFIEWLLDVGQNDYPESHERSLTYALIRKVLNEF